MYYVDLLADSGINKIEKDLVLGSPIIASNFAYSPFDKLLLVELDQKRAGALELRLKRINMQSEIFVGNCNDKIDDLLEHLPFGSHYLAFIDCEGLEVKWETMEKLLNRPGDVIFTFQTQEIRRTWGNAMSKKSPMSKVASEKLLDFYGDDTWKTATSEKDLLEYYKKKISNVKILQTDASRTLIKDVNVESQRGGFHYNLIFATRETKTGSPWFESVVGSIKKRTEKNTGKFVKLALDILSGRSTNLEVFV